MKEKLNIDLKKAKKEDNHLNKINKLLNNNCKDIFNKNILLECKEYTYISQELNKNEVSNLEHAKLKEMIQKK